MKLQQTIYNNILARGYLDDWTLKQQIARQLSKVVEEVAELCDCVIFQRAHYGNRNNRFAIMEHLDLSMQRSGELARKLFKDKEGWDSLEIDETPENFYKELSDVIVTANVLAELLNRHFKLEVDINELAIKKSETDIQRGATYHEK